MTNFTSNAHMFVFCGEQSGDLHGSHLIKALKKLDSNISITGVSGPKMREEGIKGPLVMEDFEVMGLSDVLCNLPKLYRHFHKILDYILLTNPQLILLIDYPGFNLRLAKALRDKKYSGKIIQYVSPSVWAYGKHRIQKMAETLDMLLTIYPFEPAYFSETSLKVAYVGNPICEYLKTYHYDNDWQKKLSIPSLKKLIAFFPGSRPHEIIRNLSLLIDTATLYKNFSPETVFGISCAQPIAEEIIKNTLKKYPNAPKNIFFLIPKEYTYELMRDSSSAVAKSGTVTLELALHKCPTVVFYKLTRLNRWYAQFILNLKLPYYCIVNILGNKKIFPELIERGLSANNLFYHLKQLNNNEKNERDSCLNNCSELIDTLGNERSSSLAANFILEILK